MQACAATNKKPPSKPKRKRSRKNMSAVTPVPILKERKPLHGAFILAIAVNLLYVPAKSCYQNKHDVAKALMAIIVLTFIFARPY